MKPIIGITTGCLCGIGPEITAKSLQDPRVLNICKPRVFGNAEVSKASFAATECGKMSMSAVDDAVHAVMTGEVQAIVTAPINKSHWKTAGSPFLGHTEYLAHVSGAGPVAMMMVSPKLKVTLVTTHIPLADVPKSITKEQIREVAKLTYEFLQTKIPPSPPFHKGGTGGIKIAICALNPHAGDSGTMGKEEEQIIVPAIRELNKIPPSPPFSKGGNGGIIKVSGPYPADTIFWRTANGEFDAVIAMYHDQALIPIKTLDFRDTVNVTLGLPFIRTSPGHGTAEDIKGKGIADHTNMVRAIEMAVSLI